MPEEKYQALQNYLRELGCVAVAFSGGVDSTFLLKTAQSVLVDGVLAVTAKSCSFPEMELKEAIAFCEKENIRYIICDSEELEVEGFAQNPQNRCYLCKNELFTKIRVIAEENGMAFVAEGSNVDDAGDYRPGLQAIKDHGINSPLRHAGLTKAEIRELSRQIDLPTWQKPSFACLASRFPYGEIISPGRLSMVDKAEEFLLDLLGRESLKPPQVRVRFHGTLARIETDKEGFGLLINNENREAVYTAFKKIGFTYVALDLLGYRTGSMNETL